MTSTATIKINNQISELKVKTMIEILQKLPPEADLFIISGMPENEHLQIKMEQKND